MEGGGLGKVSRYKVDIEAQEAAVNKGCMFCCENQVQLFGNSEVEKGSGEIAEVGTSIVSLDNFQGFFGRRVAQEDRTGQSSHQNRPALLELHPLGSTDQTKAAVLYI